MKNKVVLITGGSSGFGKAAAELFTQQGAKVIISARSEAGLKQAKADTGCDAYFSMDVTNPDDWQNLRAYILGRYGRIDVLINNAGAAVSVREITEQKIQDIDAVIKLNLTSVVYGAQAFANVFKAQEEGTIINISSACAKHSWPGWSVYAAAKAGVTAFSKNLYVDLRPYNIRVTCIIPGAGATDFMLHSGARNIKTKLKAEDVAEAMLSVCRLPEHAVVEELILWGSDQAVIPL